MIGPDDFTDDVPWQNDVRLFERLQVEDRIEGVELARLVTHGDNRGDLTVLLSNLQEEIVRPPHVYLVTAVAGSIRAWVFHRRQHDRLAFTNGEFRVVLYDIRAGSPTEGRLTVLDLGAANPALLTIPPFVVHGVQNRGTGDAIFVNMPTRAYDPAHPDKARLAWNHPGIPYTFD